MTATTPTIHKYVRKTIRECIEAVEGACIPTEPLDGAWNQPIGVAVEYLRALLEMG